VVHGTVRSMFRLFGAVAMSLVVAAGWLAGRLSEGPLELSFLQPYIERALTRSDGSLSVTMDATVLAWDSDAHLLEIRAENARAVSDGAVIASAPELSVSLSGPALLHGVIAPRGLRVLRPRIRLIRGEDGQIQMGMSADEPEPDAGADSWPAVQSALMEMLDAPGGYSATGQLQRFEIVNADIAVSDRKLKLQWHLPKADLRFLRDAKGIVGHARLEAELGAERAHLDVDGFYRSSERVVEATLGYGNLRPALLAELAPELDRLKIFQLPTGGSLSLRWALGAGGLPDLRFDLAGGHGVLDMSSDLGVSWPVEAVSLRGSITNNATSASLDEMRIDMGGPVISLTAKAEDIQTALKAEAEAHIDDLPMELLKGLWPEALAPNPRSWIVANLSEGKADHAFAKFRGHVKPGHKPDDIEVDELTGKIFARGVTVQYLAPMPVVKNVGTEATFDANTFTLDSKGGEVFGLKLEDGGKIVLSGLSAAMQYADINLKISGPIADALKLIDSKPLGWAARMGIAPAKVKGDAVTELNLHFPLLQDLKLDQLQVKAKSQTHQVGIPQVALGLDLSEANLALEVDAKGMDVLGKGKLGGLPTDLKWRENFSKSAPFQSRYDVSTVLDDAGRALVGLDTAPFQPPFMTGPAPVQLTATLNPGLRGDVDVKANLQGVAMSLPGLNWSKRANVTGSASALIKLWDGKLADIPRFAVATADGLEVQGQVGFDNGLARKVQFSRAKWGRTDVRGDLAIAPMGAGLSLDITGSSFDAREVISGYPSDIPVDKRKPPDHAHDHDPVTPLAVKAKLDQVWLSDDGAAKDMSVQMKRDGRGDVRSMLADGQIGEAKPLHLEIKPAVGVNHRDLKLTSGDAGAVFRAFGVFDDVKGGELDLEGFYDDANPWQPLSGECKVKDYQVMKAPVLARLLTVAALTGIVEVLSGDGIHFSTMDVPFTLTQGVMDIKDARASGTALGLTARGQVDLDNGKLALEGTVVPAYVINSVFSQIPLVGKLLTNEKGGGVIAMNYSIKGKSDDPSVSVNPLSALTPGFLRKLFNIFDDGEGREVRPEGAPKE